tara:strand:+ start:1392 stop:1832 length:441 start_codon:yes stop_codon:yes gene_type:complete
MRKNILIAALFGLAVPAISVQAEGPDFEKDIYPFIKESCLECHKPPYEDERGRTRKPKGGLVMATKEGLLKGAGDEDDGWEEIIVAGKPDDSSIYTSTMLSMSDDDHMPPEDKAEELTDAQKELLKAWIAAGADFGDWTADPEFAK